MRFLRITALLTFALMAFAISSSAQVTVTGSTGANMTYTTLGAAFTAINGTAQTGNNINVAITANTTETGPAVLNSGAWTTLTIRPTAAATISGATTTGRGLIELNGADNVTIDGSITVGGTTRDLTFQNTAVNTVTYTSVVRLAVFAATQTSADNNTVRNAILLGSATGLNISTATSTTTGGQNTTFGIYAGGNGGAAVPTVLTSVTTNSAPTGTTINNFTATNNSINAVARGVVFNGVAATVSAGTLTVTNNTIGDQGTPTPATPPYITPATTVYAKGLWIAGTTSLAANGNTIKNITSYVGTTLAGIELNAAIGAGSIAINDNSVTNVVNSGTGSGARGIDVASASTANFTAARNIVTNVQTLASSTIMAFRFAGAATAGTIERNNLSGVNSRGASTFGAFGLTIDGGSNLVIRNNFISDVQHNMTGGNAFSTAFGVFGLRLSAGTGHRVYHNSINLFAAYAGTPNTGLLSAAFAIVGVGQTGIDVRNNIFSNTTTGGTTSIAHVSIHLPPSGTSAMNLTINNNDYWTGTTVGVHGVSHVGTTYAATPAGPVTYAGLYSLLDFNPADTANILNLRTYTNILSAAGTNDNASQKIDPVFVSTTDLHIPAASLLVDAGAVISAGLDIDGQIRVDTNDIGADETDGVTPPANDIAATAILVPATGSAFVVGATTTPQASFQNIGTATQTGVQVRFTITGPGGYIYINTQTITTIAPNQTVTVPFAATPAFTTLGTYATTAAVTTPDANMGNDAVTGSFTVIPAITGGTVNVGTGETFTSLTNPGGIFNSINGSVVASNITINITTDLTGETGSIPLNPIAGGFTVTIKPSGAARTITSTTTATALMRFIGSDNVTINGSLTTGGTTRDLTLTMANTTGSGTVVVFVGSQGTGAGATGFTLKNTIINGGAASPAGTLTTFGIFVGDQTGAANGADNDNLLISNNLIQRARIGIQAIGVAAPGLNDNTIITGNTFGGTAAADFLGVVGINIGQTTGSTVSRNTVRNILNTFTADAFGIIIGAGSINTSVLNNTVTNLETMQAADWGATGINIATAAAASNILVANNMVSDIRGESATTTFLGDTVVGIRVSGTNTGGINIYYNSVNLFGAYPGFNGATVTAAFMVNATGVTGLDVRNNIFVNTFDNSTVTTDKNYAIYTNAPNTMFTTINYNDYFVSGTEGVLGAINSADVTTLAALQTATAQDVNSISADPLFVLTTDLHISSIASLVVDAGTPIAAVIRDFDLQLRSQAAPPLGVGTTDIGADELLAPVAATADISGQVTAADGRGIRNAVITVSGGNLTQPVTVRTSSFGYYRVEGLEVGETYIVSIVSKRFTFPNPTMIIALQENLDAVNFVANPIE